MVLKLLTKFNYLIMKKLNLLLILFISLVFIACPNPDENDDSQSIGGNNKAVTKTPIMNLSDTESKGGINGAFSVAHKKQVIFSKGNLQYSNSNTYSFAENQYDLNSDDETLFSWNNNGNGYTDWGKNKISNGGNQSGLWRVLLQREWHHLINNRPYANFLSILSNVNGVSGLLILPDNAIKNLRFRNGDTDEWKQVNIANVNLEDSLTAKFIAASNICEALTNAQIDISSEINVGVELGGAIIELGKSIVYNIETTKREETKESESTSSKPLTDSTYTTIENGKNVTITITAKQSTTNTTTIKKIYTDTTYVFTIAAKAQKEISATEFSKAQSGGVVFLPTAGYNDDGVKNEGTEGYYWSSSENNSTLETKGYCLSFDKKGVNVATSLKATKGASVRLVADTE